MEGPVEQHEVLPSEEIKRRMREKAELVAMLESRNGKPVTPAASETEPPLQASMTGRITADGRKLAGLMSRAKKLEAIAEAAAEKANATRQAASQARGELGSYMSQHGLV